MFKREIKYFNCFQVIYLWHKKFDIMKKTQMPLVQPSQTKPTMIRDTPRCFHDILP